MSKQIVTQEQKLLIEKMGVVFEKSGIPPAAGRVLALLLVADNTELTFEEITETLGISKSVISNTINLLLSINKIEYITKPGDRKRYFKLRVSFWRQDMLRDLQGQSILADLLKQVLEQRPGNTTDFNNNLKEIIDFLDFLVAEIPTIYEKWEKRVK